MADEEVDFSKLPLEERCTHKNWKARVSAYEELVKLFSRIDDEKSTEWNKYISLVRKFPADTNAAAQEKGLEAALIFMENSAFATRIVGEIVSSVIAKCLTAPKARSKELASEIVMMCIEIEKFEVVQDELMKGMELKNPKVVAATINLCAQILRDFGPTVLNLKTLIKKLPILIEDRDKAVREETKKLIIAFYRWIGPAFKVQLSSLKPVVLTELETEFEKLGSDKPRQNRFLRSQQAKKEKAVVDEGGEDQEDGGAVDEGGAPEIDLYDLLEPVNILSKLPNEFYKKVEEKKWQDRKEALDELQALTSNPKLEPGDYGDLVRVLKRIISKDANVMVVAVAGKCLHGLANGLKKKFSPYAPSCIGTILEKFKEKKPMVLNNLKEASDSCYISTSLEPIQEDVIQALGNKNPNIKTETALFLSRAFSKTPSKLVTDKKLMKPFLTALLTNLNESDPVVREAASEALGVALKANGEKAMSPYLQDVEAAKLQKIKEFAEKAVVMKPTITKSAPKSAPATKPVTRPAVPATNANAAKKKAVVKKPTVKSGSVAKKPLAKQNSSEDFTQGLEKTRGSPPPPEDKHGRIDISGLLTPNLIEKIADKSWTVREDHLQKVARMIENKKIQGNIGDLPHALCERLTDANKNIASTAIVLCQNLAIALGPHAKQHVRTFLPVILSLLGDNKTSVRSNVVACMNAWAENVGVEKFLQGEAIHDALKVNNPYIRQELFYWLANRLPEVPLKSINKDELSISIPIVYASIEDRHAEVRKSAQEVVPAFMMHLGHESMSRATSKLKPASKTMIQILLDKHRHVVADKIRQKVERKPEPKVERKPEPKVERKPEPKVERKPEPKVEPDSYEGFEGEDIAMPPPTVQHNGQDGHRSRIRGRVWNIPPQYQIDFDAIDNMFGPKDLEKMPPLRLYDTNIDSILNEPPVVLPTRRCVTRGVAPALSGDTFIPPRASQSIDQVVAQVGGIDIQLSLEAIVQLDVMLNDDEVANVMSSRVDHLLSMVATQIRRTEPSLSVANVGNIGEINNLYNGIVKLLKSLYKGRLLPKRPSKDTLRILLLQLLTLLADPNVVLLPDSEFIIGDVNILIVGIIEKSDHNAIFCALIRLLNETLQTCNNKRLLELTIKCQWKLLKEFTVWTEEKTYPFDVEGYLREFFAFMRAHPFISFATRDITPMKTMKTILHGVVNMVGPQKVDAALKRIPEYDSSEAGEYIAKLVTKETRAQAQVQGN